MKRRLFSLLLAFALLCTLLPQVALPASAATYSGNCGAEGDNLTWSFDTKTGLLTIEGSGAMANYDDWNNLPPWYDYCESITAVSLPNGLTSIGHYAFYECIALTSVTIPDSVTSIGDGTFSNCSELISVTIGNGVTSIGELAFAFCYSLTSVTIPDSVTSIGNSAFFYCSDLTSVTIGNGVTSIDVGTFSSCSELISVTIGNGVTSIGEGAFSYCSALTSVTIPDSVTSIGDGAFEGCSALAGVTIGNSVTSFGNNAFAGCSALTAIDVAPGNLYYASINGVLFDKAKAKLILYPRGKADTSYQIPGSVTSIGHNAFCYCDGLTSVAIPDSVTSIGDYAFSDCNGLTSVTIGSGVTSIGYCAFEGCSALTSVTIPDSVTSIGENAFSDCNGLTSVTIGNGVTSIGNSAFEGCWSLTSVTIGNGVTSIGDYAFKRCLSLTSVTIPASVTSIGHGAFFCCDLLTSVTIPANVTYIGYHAFGYDNYYEALDGFTIYGVLGSAANNYATENGFQFVALTAPVITAQPQDYTGLAGTKASFTVAATGSNLRYQWQYKKVGMSDWADWTGKTAASVSFKPATSSNGCQYRCVISNEAGSVTSNVATLTVLSKPTITTQPKSQTVAFGNTVTFTVSATGSNLRYQWQYKKVGMNDWADWTGKTAASVSFKPATSSNDCQYRCVVSNEAGSVTSGVATLTVLGKPVITTQPKSQTVAFGNTVTFTVAATGSNLRYQWQYKKVGMSDWADWTGKTAASVSFKPASSSNGCQYRCVVSNEAGSVTSGVATLTVLSKPVITTQPKSQTVAYGNTVTFTVAATGSNLRYQWQYKKVGMNDWADWTGKTAASVSFKPATSSNGCLYRCVISNEAGTVTSNAATLTVSSGTNAVIRQLA